MRASVNHSKQYKLTEVLLFPLAYTEAFDINEAWQQVLKLEEPNNTVQEKIDAQPAADLYLLYTRRNPLLAQVIIYDNVTSLASSNFNPNVQTVVLVHGWLENKDNPMSFIVKNALFRHNDVNVIIMDWSRYSRLDYISATRGVPSVGRGLGLFLTFLRQNTGIAFDLVHLVGFSLGGHVVGSAGRQLGGEVARITALDPAGPLWYRNNERLSSTDARYVEAIHTNAGGLGILMNVGDADFFPNGGSNQPGCNVNNMNNIACDHYRSYMLFAASVNTKHLVGRQCPSALAFLASFCRGKSLPMGNTDLSKFGTGVYILSTGPVYPYLSL